LEFKKEQKEARKKKKLSLSVLKKTLKKNVQRVHRRMCDVLVLKNLSNELENL
jgi:hypothetical protein